MNPKQLNRLPLESQDSFGTIAITQSEFEALRTLIYNNFGINLTDQKRSLVMGRLQKYLKVNKFSNFSDYYEHVISDRTGKALEELINRISTNHTFFFRENDHFKFFSDRILPEIESLSKKQAKGDIRIWCAGCSYGDEPYSFIISMMEYFGKRYHSWDAGVLATDISANALNFAIKGVYPEERLKLMPDHIKHKYFKKIAPNTWEVNEIVKKEVTFRRLNLMRQTTPFKSKFHLISCRNVMIYFDQPTRDMLAQRFYKLNRPGGYLFIGHSETLRGKTCPYDYLQPAVYRKGDR